MVYSGQVIEALGNTSEARTVVRWLAAAETIPKGTPGRDGAGRADLSHRDVAMIVLGMAAPVAQRAPEYATELASLQRTATEGAKVQYESLVDMIVRQLSAFSADHEKCVIGELWLPMYEGGWREARASLHTEDGFVDVHFHQAISDVKADVVQIDDDWAWARPEVAAPVLPQWTEVRGSVLGRLARLFVQDESMPAELEDSAA